MAGVKKEERISKEERKALIGKIKTDMTEINRRFKEIQEEERQSGVPSEFINTQRVAFSQLTKTKSKYKFATGNLQKMSVKRLKAIQRQQKAFLKSKYSTAEGRAEIFQKQYETFTDTYDTSKENYGKIVKVLGSKSFRGLRQITVPSDVIIEYLKENGWDKSQAVVDAIPKFDTLPPDANAFLDGNIARLKRMLDYFVNNPDKEGREAYEECFNISEESDTGE